MGYLAITFRGPFAFCVGHHSMDVFAAICDNHHAAIFTLLREHPLCGRHRRGGEYTYVLEGDGIESHVGKIDYHEEENTSVILDAEAGSKVDVCQANFCISLPRPFAVYPLSPAYTEVVKTDPAGALRNYATGLRFLFHCDVTKPISLKTPCLHGNDSGSELPLDFGDFAVATGYADIDVRYVGPEADDAEHLDAISCFDNTMKLFALPWWLNYDKYGKQSLLTRTGSDCKSAVVLAGRT